MVSCIVVLTLTTPDTTSPVQLLKKLKGKESENLIVVFAACAWADVGPAARNIDTKIKTTIENLTVLLLKRWRVRALILSADAAAVLDMTLSPFNRFVGSCFDL